MSALDKATVAQLRAFMAQAKPGEERALLNTVLRLTAKWRSQLLSNTMVAQSGRTIQNGPFAGMCYLPNAAEGALAARLLGSYESEIHPHLMAFVADGLDEVVDIGSAEGYYAVGLARLMPKATIYAHDTDPRARSLCTELASLNNVADRIRVEAEFAGADFERFVGRRCLFIVDIEGAERELLDPDRWPALRFLSLIVETHPGAAPGITEALVERFRPTHDFEVVRQSAKTTPVPEWLQELGHLDSLLAVWEWRSHPTPWLVLRPSRAKMHNIEPPTD